MTRLQIIRPTVPLRAIPGQVGRRDSQLCYGELFEATRTERGQVFGRHMADNYEGWVAADALSQNLLTPSHRVVAHSAFVYPRPDVKSLSLLQLPFGSHVTIDDTATENGYVKIHLHDGTGWIWHAAVRPLAQLAGDHTAIAETLLGVPYLWGGRSGSGIDCSGLVQQALALCGIACPRDAYQQEALGTVVDRAHLQRGDLLFAKGHVAIAVDLRTVIHANEELDSRVAYGVLAEVDSHYDFLLVKRPPALAASIKAL